MKRHLVMEFYRFLQLLTNSFGLFKLLTSLHKKKILQNLTNSYKKTKILTSFYKVLPKFKSDRGEYPFPLSLYLLQILTKLNQFLQSLHKSQNLHGSRLRRAVATFAGNSTKRWNIIPSSAHKVPALLQCVRWKLYAHWFLKIFRLQFGFLHFTPKYWNVLVRGCCLLIWDMENKRNYKQEKCFSSLQKYLIPAHRIAQ